MIEPTTGRGAPGRPKSPEHVAKIRAALTGRKLSPEHRAAVSAGTREAMWRPEVRAKVLAGQDERARKQWETRPHGTMKQRRDTYRAEQLERQEGHCAICQADLPIGRGEVDHDHGHCKGGCPECWRGVLCGPCNRTLGHYEAIRDIAEAYLCTFGKGCGG